MIALEWPLPEELLERPLSFAAIGGDGRLLGARIADDEQWRFDTVTDVPDRYEKALLAFEDKRFYRHPGIDPIAIVRAARDNAHQGRVVSGGSTITMQLARLLTPPRARTLKAKLAETWMAFRLEWHFDKSELLAHYASHAPFGGNVVGLNAASWRYFDRPPKDLSWAEAALLAVLPNKPALLHPSRNRQALAARRDDLLNRLHRSGEFDDIDLAVALAEPIPKGPQTLPRLAPHLIDTLNSRHRSSALHLTTISTDLQRGVADIADRNGAQLSERGIHDIAIVVIDHRVMETRAYVGNRLGDDPDREGAMVDIAQRPRSSGSLLKPFLYGLMLQEGLLLPGSLVPDVPIHIAGYSPENFDRKYRGATPAHLALSRSLNVPMVAMLREYGVGRFHERLEHFGLTTLFRPARDYGLSLILGGSEATLWELTALYANLAASASKGRRHIPRSPTILAHSGAERSGKASSGTLSQGASWLVLDALLEVARPGQESRWRDYGTSQAIAWKTGTSFGLRDGWSIGSNSAYTVGVWTGNADGSDVAGLTGTLTAAPVMLEIFSLLGTRPWLPKPLHALKQINVCAHDGFLVTNNCQSETSDAPVESHFSRVSPNIKTVHLDGSGQRVHSVCESPLNMNAVPWFILPPNQEHFWRLAHPGYSSPPQWRHDCRGSIPESIEGTPMALIYPQENTEVLIPVQLDGNRGRVLFRAVHRDARATIRWHVGSKYLGITRQFHEQALWLDSGAHQLTLIDDDGNRYTQTIGVINR